ncbi:MAG: response regulator transcription factor [Clostridia bacterium]|nr:response regulator transcription factor [Clostridia bacterium]
MDLKIAICDDDKDYINTIEKYIDDVGENGIECDTYYSGEELIVAYTDKGLKYDIIFLDMEMDGLNGIETANKIRETDENALIIFITSYKQYVFESFKCSPFRFLLKPVEYDEFERVLRDAQKKLSKKNTTFTFSENQNIITLFYDDVIFFESKKHYVYVHTKDKIHKIRTTLSKICERLDKNIIFRVHKSFAVNFKYIQKISATEIALYGTNTIIPISRALKKEVLHNYTDFVERDLLL